jgi:hypothetical protein
MWGTTAGATHRGASTPRRTLAIVLGASLWTAPLAAKVCGDDVGGHDVPCACGDVVVSSVALGDDPILHGACPHDGLIVRAPDAVQTLVIDLRGRALRGTGAGVGIRLLAGGPGGARVVSTGGPATIVGFQDGIVARGSDAIARIEDVVVSASGRDGLRVEGPEFEIQRTEVRGAKRDGFALSGRGFLIVQTHASDCGRFGYNVMGNAGQIGQPGAGNVAERSGNHGFNVMGVGHLVAECTAVFGRKSGMHLQAMQLDVRGCRATDNSGDGIEGLGTYWRLADNEALRNAGNGIAVRGEGLVDGGGNRGTDNRGQERPRGAVQCRIAGKPCML